jgi:ABC-type thiamin/hydroxymethylpyrimidine transport system permease subunit
MVSMPLWRAHPIRFAALLGAIFGLLDTLLVEISGVLHPHSQAAVIAPLLIPHPGAARLGPIEAALIVLVTVLANIFVWAILFALPTAIVVGIYRAARALRR